MFYFKKSTYQKKRFKPFFLTGRPGRPQTAPTSFAFEEMLGSQAMESPKEWSAAEGVVRPPLEKKIITSLDPPTGGFWYPLPIEKPPQTTCWGVLEDTQRKAFGGSKIAGYLLYAPLFRFCSLNARSLRVFVDSRFLKTFKLTPSRLNFQTFFGWFSH